MGYLNSLNIPCNILGYEEFDFVQNDQPYNDILPLDVTQYLAQETATKKKVQFSLDFKLKGIEEAKRTSNGEFARKYGIDRTVITRWRQSEAKLRRAKANGGQFRAKGGGMKRDDVLDRLLYEWYCQQNLSSNVKTSGTMLRVKARELAATCGSGSEGSKCSNGWLQGFLKKYSIQLPHHKWTLKEPGESNNGSMDESPYETMDQPSNDTGDVTQYLTQDMTQNMSQNMSQNMTQEMTQEMTQSKKTPNLSQNDPGIETDITRYLAQDLTHDIDKPETKAQNKARTLATLLKKTPGLKIKTKKAKNGHENSAHEDLNLEVTDEHDNNLVDPEKLLSKLIRDGEEDSETDNEMDGAAKGSLISESFSKKETPISFH